MAYTGNHGRQSHAVIALSAILLAAILFCAACSGDSAGDEATVRTVTSLAALDALLESLPLNTAASPWELRVEGVDLGRGLGGVEDGLAPLFMTFHGRYVSLDLDACTGATFGWGSNPNQNTAARPDNDKLVRVILPRTASRAGYRNFQRSVSLKSVRFPSGLKTIGDRAFEGCTALESVELPAGLESIADHAFADCAALRRVVMRGATPPKLGGHFTAAGDPETFAGARQDFAIIVPAGAVAGYRTASGWSWYADRIRERP